ncbi:MULTISPECIES: hypothetical protein [Uliginosibacterium]|jgi:hypothetical protein|uniref:YqjK-like protein n=1 Tax=Uliginosibacterium aquaticum TaxID=2731212 RepID=A0ABX2IIT9_9RHOO|nr:MULTISPECIES: hypothetical protein [Uliginosibacterium]MDO6385662.1 hypothetical protein [Uliginosibacterium sp. 31-12]NSL56699.1 hypothetical protein [Uliginosibacterium aquaticum]PLK47627.1 hypothetical protein C0V76_16745 [Uliginosibacterium sp. TH139]
MNQRQSMRKLRKEMLLLQSAQYRAAMRHRLGDATARSLREELTRTAWLDGAGALLGSILPARWGRWLNLALGVVRIAKTVVDRSEKQGPVV